MKRQRRKGGSQGFILGGHLPPLESYVPPLEFALHTPTLHGTPLKILNRPLCPPLAKTSGYETLGVYKLRGGGIGGRH